MSLARLLAWLILLAVAVYIVLLVLSSVQLREEPWQQWSWLVPRIECPETGYRFTVDPTPLVAVVDGRRVYPDELIAYVNGSRGYVYPELYFNLTLAYKASRAVRVDSVNRSYVLAPIPYERWDDEYVAEWVANRSACLTYHLYYASRAVFVPYADYYSGYYYRVETPDGPALGLAVLVPYLPAVNVTISGAPASTYTLVEGYAYSDYSVLSFEEKLLGCVYDEITGLYICPVSRVYAVRWYSYLASTLGHSEEHETVVVYDPYESGETRLTHYGAEYRGYPLAMSSLTARGVVREWSNETHRFIVYDAEFETSTRTRGFRVYGVLYYASLQWTPRYGLSPVLRGLDGVKNPHTVFIYADPVHRPVRGGLLFYAEDTVDLHNVLVYGGEHFVRSVVVPRRVLQVNITYDAENPIMVLTPEFDSWSGYGAVQTYFNVTIVEPPAVSTRVEVDASYLLASGYLEDTANIVRALGSITVPSEYAELYRYYYATQLLSSTLTSDEFSPGDLNETVTLLVYGKGLPETKIRALSYILDRNGVKHEVKTAVSRAKPGEAAEVLVLLAEVEKPPEFWELPEELYRVSSEKALILYDPWQNSVFCSFNIVELPPEQSEVPQMPLHWQRRWDGLLVSLEPAE